MYNIYIYIYIHIDPTHKCRGGAVGEATRRYLLYDVKAETNITT